MIFQALIKHSLNSRDAKKTAMPISLTRCTHIADPLAQNTRGADHRGGYGSKDLQSSQTLSNDLRNNRRINIAKGLEKPCRM